MRNIKRQSKPISLTNNAITWTKELMDEIYNCSLTGSKVEEKFYSKYNKADIKEALITMYNNLCCYCESKIGTTDYSHIEHRKPKRSKDGVPKVPYPELTYDWGNLHLACTKCNTAKGTKFDTINPILDAVSDIPIEDHFTYTKGVDGINWTPCSLQGSTTELHADLNREPLPTIRLNILANVILILKEIKDNPANPSNAVALREVKKKIKEPYGSLVQFLLKSFEK